MRDPFLRRVFEEAVEALLEVEAHGFGEVRVDLCAGDAGMPQQDLDGPKVNAAFNEVRSKAVAKSMRCHVLGQVCLRACTVEGPVHALLIDRSVAMGVGKDPCGMAMRTPKTAQCEEQGGRECYGTFAVSFTHDANEHLRAKDVFGLQTGGLGNAQAQCVHGDRAEPVERFPEAGEQSLALFLRKDDRQT